ncbi:MAG: hypothetical protein LQ343_002396 [Gyalolechia ehrenbergii]|nr:MAG: hypothetical protein LQ343_002396 [Gyalolechia ehrenbergii]
MTVCPTVLQDAQFMVKNDLESYDLTKNNEKQLHEQFSHTKETITTAFGYEYLVVEMDLQELETPESCVAEFCLIPIGTPTASVSQEVADVQRLMKQSKLSYSMHSAGTTVGRTDKKQSFSEKVTAVNTLLAADKTV